MSEGALKLRAMISLCALLVLSLCSWSAHAEEAGEAPDESGDEAASSPTVLEARRHFQQAVALYHDGNVEGALTEFRASYDLNPVIHVLFNIAVALRDLHRYDEAIDTIQEYLDQSEGEPEERISLAEELAEELSSLLATISISCNERGAEVLLNNELYGQTPLEAPLQLSTGEYDLLVRLGGFHPYMEHLEVHSGQELDINVELQALPQPWYRRWWIWTIVGSVVAVGAVTGIAVGIASRDQGILFDVVVQRGGAQ